ncbi:MAG: hypothetical protein ABI347_11870 [Nitrososphaera sp.]|jgi:hypothetical protein
MSEWARGAEEAIREKKMPASKMAVREQVYEEDNERSRKRNRSWC